MLSCPVMRVEAGRRKEASSLLEFNTVIQTYQPGFSDLHKLVHMLVCEGQAQQWMKTANWENPDRFLELQLGEHSANLLHDQAHAIARQLPSSS